MNKRRCHICGSFVSKEKPCNQVHNMEKYHDRMYAESMAEQDMMFDDEMERAGGLDAIQERERRDYYVGKYGEY